MSDESLRVVMTSGSGLRARVRFGERPFELETDEPPPLGEGQYPSPAELLAAAVGNCLLSSLRFCLQKARIPSRDVTAVVDLDKARNAEGRMRVSRIRVRLVPIVPTEDAARIARCLDVFQSFCTVAESVCPAIPIEVVVEPRVAAGALEPRSRFHDRGRRPTTTHA